MKPWYKRGRSERSAYERYLGQPVLMAFAEGTALSYIMRELGLEDSVSDARRLINQGRVRLRRSCDGFEDDVEETRRIFGHGIWTIVIGMRWWEFVVGGCPLAERLEEQTYNIWTIWTIEDHWKDWRMVRADDSPLVGWLTEKLLEARQGGWPHPPLIRWWSGERPEEVARGVGA